MRTPAERGIYGRWLTDVREARGYKTAAAARKALSDAGTPISHSTYAEYESGTKVPSRNHLPLLERFWGPVYDPEPPQAEPLLAAALIGLTDELAAWRMERVELWARLQAAEAELVSLRGRSTNGGSGGQPVPQRTGG